MLLEIPNFRGMPFDRWLAGANLLVVADVACPNPTTDSAMGFVAEVIALYGGTAPPKTHGRRVLLQSFAS